MEPNISCLLEGVIEILEYTDRTQERGNQRRVIYQIQKVAVNAAR
jgi:hypothetical protein